MKKILKLLVFIAIPFIFAFIGSISADSASTYQEILKPSYSPPSIVFPIAWTIIYFLMGISSYLVYTSNASKEAKTSALTVYLIQLIINSSWTFFFFNMQWYLFSFIIIILLIFLVIVMIIKFYEINKLAGILNIPYLLWLYFAGILTLNIYMLSNI